MGDFQKRLDRWVAERTDGQGTNKRNSQKVKFSEKTDV